MLTYEITIVSGPGAPAKLPRQCNSVDEILGVMRNLLELFGEKNQPVDFLVTVKDTTGKEGERA